MLITFKSKAAADIVMYKEHAQRILELLDKEVDRGIIVRADTKKAIAILEAAMAESKAHPASEQVSHDILAHAQLNDDGNHEHNPVESVSFSSRVYPLLEMLRVASEQDQDVVWGV